MPVTAAVQNTTPERTYTPYHAKMSRVTTNTKRQQIAQNDTSSLPQHADLRDSHENGTDLMQDVEALKRKRYEEEEQQAATNGSRTDYRATRVNANISRHQHRHE